MWVYKTLVWTHESAFWIEERLLQKIKNLAYHVGRQGIKSSVFSFIFVKFYDFVDYMNTLIEKPKIGEYATMEALREAFPDSWVLIGQPDLDSQLHLLGGLFYAVVPTKQEAYQVLKTMPELKFFAIRYTSEYAQEGDEFLLWPILLLIQKQVWLC